MFSLASLGLGCPSGANDPVISMNDCHQMTCLENTMTKSFSCAEESDPVDCKSLANINHQLSKLSAINKEFCKEIFRTPEFSDSGCETRRPKAGELFSSDSFPSEYPDNQNCWFELTALRGERVHLTFVIINVGESGPGFRGGPDRCYSDSIAVIDTNGTQIHKFCGDNEANVEVQYIQNPVCTYFENVFFSFISLYFTCVMIFPPGDINRQ